ncbi:putative ubiquitin-protein ligase [Trypanosoma rangeli]|uniref:Putative ubiquitin-protein ligase n=1 Tax=Trypanosoma rangeli TaxID=5698 RepID=A0A422P472_TRYRA|nr:putative ubiquitin-protein ligase [Trypanosoma rangeli]RNF12537.1 putative ubiquitin-protein ligase [Trypanosoma rangeli]|eukprot:RNF12537.1 putative ubiquitin-protein ligase [Trypanosoma rangeli]
MDELSMQYLRMANGPHGQLHDPADVVNFVEQMQLVVERSSAPRRNFLLDTTTPRGDVIITEASAMKPGNGWITLQVTEGIRRGVHEWCVKIEHQGETTDGSGLMLGIVPKSFAKYDSFISQGGGWCLSRAGKFYGHWRRQDNNLSVVFGAGDRVVFILDYEAARMTVRVGDKSVVGEISNIAPEVYPAISLHYRHQFVRFEYHKVHDRHAKKLNWIERFAFPHASVYLPLTPDQLEKVPLDSYVFSSLFNEKGGQPGRWIQRQGSATFSSIPLDEAIPISEEYETARAASARLTVVLRAIQAVRRYCGGGVTPVEVFLDRNITAEALRKNWHALSSRSAASRDGMDAALNCGALVLIHMFVYASMTLEGATVLPLVHNLQEYLRGVTLFSLGETSSSPHFVGSSISPEVMRQALDGVAKLLEQTLSNDTINRNNGGINNAININGNSKSIMKHTSHNGPDSIVASALVELLVLLSLQCGSISEVLRTTRYLLRMPTNFVSQATLDWLKSNESALTPKRYFPKLNEAYDAIEDDTEQLSPFGRDFNSQILSVGYDRGAVYIHSVDGLSKRTNVVEMYALVCSTSEPLDCCPQCSYSSIAFSEAGVLLLLTNRMLAAGFAVVTYSTLLEVRQKVALADAPQWPLNSRFMALASGPGDRLVLVYDVVAAPTGAAADANTSSSVGLEMQVFASSSFPEAQWCTSLQLAPFDRTLAYCLSLRKGSVIDFGSPEVCLTTVGGHVTVEIWIKILEKDDTSVLYQHGDRSTSGEVFIETTRLEGAWRIRGGYRHDSRGMCVVTAPVSPASESRFIHVSLIFDGNWRLCLDDEEVSCTRQGPQVSLENPRQRWTAGNDCICQIAALRVWRGGRLLREIVRDSRRLLSGDEPGLVCQYFFNEPNGNVVFNHVRTGAARGRHAIVWGKFARVGCFDHPFLPSQRESSALGGTSMPVTAEPPQLEHTHVFFNGSQIGLMEQRTQTIPGFVDWKHVHQVSFFDIKTGRELYGSYVLRQRSKLGFLGCDHHGQYWELFQTGMNPGPRGEVQQQVVAVGTLSGISVVVQEKGALTSLHDSNDAKCATLNGTSVSVGCSEALFGTMHSGLVSSGGQQLLNRDTANVTFGSLAMWLLGLLSTFAEASGTDLDNHLFSPLLDDVGIRCVQEVQQLLCEHCRAVKAMNARRSANLKDSTSSSVIYTILRVLVRLIRRVRDFKLHPDTLGFSEVSESDDVHGMLHELNIAQRRRNASWKEHERSAASTLLNATNSTAATKATPNADSVEIAHTFSRKRGTSLLGVLADIINEAGFNLPMDLAVLARIIIQEGVTLFFPSANVRATLLHEILNCEQQNASQSPALNVLLDAIVRSFTDMTSAAALIHTGDFNTRSGLMHGEDKSASVIEQKLLVIKKTLSTLLAESAKQMTSRVSNESRQQQLGLLSVMAEAIGTLQLLLFSQCDGTGVANMSGTGTRRGIENIFLLPQPTELSSVLKDYYVELFNTAEIIFKRLIQRIPAASPRRSTAATSSTTTAAEVTMICDMLSSSFVGFPLHTAITALPFMVTRDESEWLLRKLNLLRVHYRALLQLFRENISMNLGKVGFWPLPALDNGLLLASSWVASFMSLGQLPAGPLGTKTPSHDAYNNSTTAIQEICDHPLLAAGLRPANKVGNNIDVGIIEKLQQQRPIWEDIAKQDDPLASKTPAGLAAAMSLAAVAVVHLSGVQLHRLSDKEQLELLAKTLLRLRNTRNELLNKRSKNPNDFSRNVCDVQGRCRFLLRFRKVSEAEFLKMTSTFLSQSFADRVLGEKLPRGGRWKRAVFLLRAQRMYHEAFLNSWLLLQFDSALKLVERVILSPGLTTAGLQAAIQTRQTNALQRLDGLFHMLQLFETDAASALKVASLLFKGSVGSQRQFETGLSGSLDSTRCAIRRTMYDILRRLRDAAVKSRLPGMDDGGDQVEQSPKTAMHGGASFRLSTLSEVLNRMWLPSDFCYLEHLRVVKVIFETICSIFVPNDLGRLRQEGTTERSHRHDARDARKQNTTASSPSGTAEDEANEVSLQRTPHECALMESLTTLKFLGQQAARVLGDTSLSLCERRGCTLFLDGLFEVLELELHRCAKYTSQACCPANGRVLEQVSLICTLASTIARSLPEGFFCNRETCFKLVLLAFRLGNMAKILLTIITSTVAATTTTTTATATTTSIPTLKLMEVCINTSVLLLCYCQPATADPLFVAEETMEITRQTVCITRAGGETLGFFLAFVIRCVATSNGGLSEIGLRCVDAFHRLVCRPPWDASFMTLRETYQCDLGAVTVAEDEEAARSKSIRLLMWLYSIGGPPTVPLSLGKKVQVSADNMLPSTEGAYIVDCCTQKNSATVISSTLYSLVEEREVFLDNLISSSNEEVILPRADVLFQFLIPTLEYFFKPPLRPHFSPLIWAVIAALLRITWAVLKNDPAASQVLLEGDILSHVDAFAFRLAAKIPLPLCYLYEVCPTVVQQLLQCTRPITFDTVVPSSLAAAATTPNGVPNALSSGVSYTQPLPGTEFNCGTSLPSVVPVQPSIFGASTLLGNAVVSRAEVDDNNNSSISSSSSSNNNNGNSGFMPSLVRLPQAHSSLSLTPSVLCFCGDKDAPVGTLTIKAAGIKSCIPLWTDGLTLETSVLLYERLFPELGEDFVIPTLWQRPGIQFTLFSLYEKHRSSGAAVMRVVLTENSIDYIMESVKGSAAIVSTKLVREDWDHWIHIAVVLESGAVTLYKDGVGTTATLPKLAASRLETLLRDGVVDRLTIGNETPTALPGSRNASKSFDGARLASVTATTTTTNTSSNNNNKDTQVSGDCAMDGVIVAVESVRVWGCARGLKAQRTTADFVAREQTLPVVRVSDGSQMTFRFSEATGDETLSENKESIGTLHGNVRWAPFPIFSGAVDLGKASRIDPTTHMELPLFIPRREFEIFFAALDRNQILRIGGEYLQTLCAHLSRQCVVAAICQMVSPGYHVLVLEKGRKQHKSITPTRKGGDAVASGAELVNPRHIIASNELVRHLINLLRYSDTGAVSDETMLAVAKFIKLCFALITTEKLMANGFREAAIAISEALHDEAESFRMELPPFSYVTTDIQLLPLAILNGPGGTISFDANSRGIEHLTLLRDRKQKVLLAKYPDAQGGWPELEIPGDNPWLYARPIVSTRAATASFTLSARSLKPLVACGIFGAIREVLTSQTKYQCGWSYFLNTPYLSLLTVRTGTTKCSALPACRLLTALLDFWREIPHFAPHDHSPLKIVLAHLNVSLMAILHRGQITPNSPPLLSPALGHYNLRVQGAFELLVAAIRLEAAWKNVSHPCSTRSRWKRLFSLWETSIGYGAPAVASPSAIIAQQDPTVVERGYVRLVPLPTSGSSVQHCPKATIFQRGNGVWYASCDRVSFSARSSVGFKRGRFYFEVRIPASGEAISVGIVTERAQQHSVLAPRGLGHDGDSWGFESVQMCRFYHGFRHEFSVRSKWKPLDVIGILLDLEAETLACVHEGRQVSMFDNLRASRSKDTMTCFFPAVSFGTGGVDVNFGAAPFACSLPVGYLPVDPSNYVVSPTSKLWILLTAVEVGETLSRSSSKINMNKEGHIKAAHKDDAFFTKDETLRLPSLFERANDAGMVYQAGRSGPYSVSLLPSDNKTRTVTVQGSEVRAGDDPCFVRGSVCVRQGRWYYEVALRGEALISVGWVTSTATPDWSRTKSLGDDNESWVLEGSRTTARHNKHQRSVGGLMWKHGDIVGCMVDCDAGTIAYSVNGTPLREMHDTNGDGVLFSSVNCVNGIMPVVSVGPKNAASILFFDEELSFRPRGYRALSTANPIRTAVEQHYCTDSLEHNDNGQEVIGPAFSPTLARSLLSSLTSLTELNFMNASAYCLEDVLNKDSSNIRYEKFKGRESALRLLVTLQNLSSLTECMIPYAHAALSYGKYDTLLSGPICRSLWQCREYLLPVVVLRILQGFFLHTNCLGENIKLTLNRRKALSLVNDLDVPVSERLRGSLFGQVYHLLHDKNVSLFCTSRNLWSVNFVGEGADDIGGPYRESITQLCSELMSSGLPLFVPSPNQVHDIGDARELFVVRPVMEPPVRLSMYQFFGRLVAGCLRSSEPLPIYLPSCIWKALVGSPVDEGDLRVVDQISVQSYHYIRQLMSSRQGEVTDDEIAELCPGGFSLVDDAGVEQELFPGGKEISVGRHNVEMFLDMALRFKLHHMGAMQIKAIAEGFHQVVPVSAVSLLKWYELEHVVCGQPDYDADALIDAARYENLDLNDVTVQYLRQVLRQFSRHERALFMRFVSGRERLPSGVRLKLMPDAHSRSIQSETSGNTDAESNANDTDGGGDGGGKSSVDVFDDNRLPHASTCFYWLSIPRYSSVEVMRERLLFAIQQCLDIDADFVVHENGNPEDEMEPTMAVNADEDEEEFEDFSHLR